jgi:hypothetical protein
VNAPTYEDTSVYARSLDMEMELTALDKEEQNEKSILARKRILIKAKRSIQ